MCVAFLMFLAAVPVSLTHANPHGLHRIYGNQIRQVVNGELSCDDDSCKLSCDLGYAPSGRAVFEFGDPAIESEARCVEAMAFLVGEGLLASLYAN